jgi:hypothetical protein
VWLGEQKVHLAVGILPAIGYMLVIDHLPEEQAIGYSPPFAAICSRLYNQPQPMEKYHAHSTNQHWKNGRAPHQK